MDNRFKLNTKPGYKNTFQGIPSTLHAVQLLELSKTNSCPILFIANTVSELNDLEDALSFLIKNETEVLRFSEWETLPYDAFSPHQDIISQRLETLANLRDTKSSIILTTINAAMTRLCPASHIDSQRFHVKTDQSVSTETLANRLTNGGYLNVDTVREHGEFSIRGALMDVFPMGADAPIRIDWFDTEIDSIRYFDPETQRSTEKVKEVKILPAKEFPTTQNGIQFFRQRFRERFDVDPLSSPIYQDISSGLMPGGIEYYLPLFFEETDCLFDYLHSSTCIVRSKTVNDYIASSLLDIKSRHESLNYDLERPILTPKEVFLEDSEIFAELNKFAAAVFDEEGTNDVFSTIPELTVNSKLDNPLESLSKFLQSQNLPILICAESAGRREALIELLNKNNLKPEYIGDWQRFTDKKPTFAITEGLLTRGFIQNEAYAVIAESELMGERVSQQRRRKHSDVNEDAIIRNLTELRLGAPVVHIDHGVGRYLGLTNLEIDGQETELLTLGYANEAKLYVPVSSLQLISRYTGADEDNAPLHRLGTEKWSIAKQKAAEKARDTAAELLEIYAKREARSGYAFSKPDDQYALFSASFPFEETPDQQMAIDAVIKDMSTGKPMDRLVCGDVGFGKTEVAMRAAFLAVQSGKQVAVLVPTTLLAQQHYENFCDRFADWPVQIELLSRFRSGKQTKEAISRLEEGKSDIVVGTHKLIQGDIQFSNLGLVIIDEEHRFGVKQKDQFKALRAEIDVLTLTATPIPRTLNMSLSGIRDLSIIATPPAKRLSVKTFVKKKDDHQIKEAILRELHRGGQVYYLHNEVETIQKAAEFITELVPEARVIVGHGQMRERELEQVMSDFYHKRSNVLVCSTIIETGIDIPNANTIIINRADKFGLAQLHQLRGRVGRSHHQAYAYLLTPQDRKVTGDAEKRLEAITMADTLGAGFTLATHDLEIRGTGELLGEGQSGHIEHVGFSLFMEMLDRAVKSLKNGEAPNVDITSPMQTEINLRIPALIPDDYLGDVHTRLMLYKRIANAETEDALKELQVEMIDRFGLLPDATKNLFRQTSLKLKAEKLGIVKIEANQKEGKLHFGKETPVDPMKLIQLIQKKPNQFRLAGADTLRYVVSMTSADDRFQQTYKTLELLH
ncbi:transcription-repair coupling factor [Marinomonas mediterranea]|jgi:transcription-repair coupling factor|uniref:Transcription-repair-coupling factor n=1 Tax=Marinomonas mediterranea (strain ATCC 700492 / JCM 21426 / NBRC 103028 / MMB-1) TaxID=717774 RepID=F2JWR0_MARM1|nr:transcription-repair coupling factor [Marinomonas mediterranea]ADZ91824.1 transcription-repair coupling factor [Marinomonas mediterranea MMB-1]WCN09778.1 transcription-repair coupling factor [Marinomonas mediterranea]WCN13860.1 transcription-repair coupling factor [Marinomonas mediterranea]WCN17916.1 transcription-repair coupling factor [Marinomonas mediterranea MMB-1]